MKLFTYLYTVKIAHYWLAYYPNYNTKTTGENIQIN